MVGGMDPAVVDYSSALVGTVAPMVIASCICSLLLTNHRLPVWRVSWFNKAASVLRRHPPAIHVAEASTGRGFKVALGYYTSCLLYFFSSIRIPFRHMAADAQYGQDLAKKKNQFGRGEPNSNAMAI
jgi:hypothetical protein